jgi:hypothetical protein
MKTDEKKYYPAPRPYVSREESYAITVTFEDGSSNHYTSTATDSCKAIANLALRFANISSTLRSPAESFALIKW